MDVCDWLARLYSDRASEEHRKQLGQFFTPPDVARFMASLAGALESDSLILEPGAGTGVLVAAVAERIAQEGVCQEWHAIAYETDPALHPVLALALGYIRHWSSSWNIQFTFEVVPDDFIMSNAWLLRPAPLFESVNRQSGPQVGYGHAAPRAIRQPDEFFRPLRPEPGVENARGHDIRRPQWRLRVCP